MTSTIDESTVDHRQHNGTEEAPGVVGWCRDARAWDLAEPVDEPPSHA